MTIARLLLILSCVFASLSVLDEGEDDDGDGDDDEAEDKRIIMRGNVTRTFLSRRIAEVAAHVISRCRIAGLSPFSLNFLDEIVQL